MKCNVKEYRHNYGYWIIAILFLLLMFAVTTRCANAQPAGPYTVVTLDSAEAKAVEALRVLERYMKRCSDEADPLNKFDERKKTEKEMYEYFYELRRYTYRYILQWRGFNPEAWLIQGDTLMISDRYKRE